jgi:aryl-alcohol dehydrogenase-like predicted oxidoreductase
VALRFILRQAKNAAVVVGVGDRHQVGRYLSCLGRPLSSTDLVAIEEALRCVRRTMSPTANRA